MKKYKLKTDLWAVTIFADKMVNTLIRKETILELKSETSWWYISPVEGALFDRWSVENNPELFEPFNENNYKRPTADTNSGALRDKL